VNVIVDFTTGLTLIVFVMTRAMIFDFSLTAFFIYSPIGHNVKLTLPKLAVIFSQQWSSYWHGCHPFVHSSQMYCG